MDTWFEVVISVLAGLAFAKWAGWLPIYAFDWDDLFSYLWDVLRGKQSAEQKG